MVDQLVIALRQLENIFWRQSDPEGLALYKALEKVDTRQARNTRHYLFINGSRWDLVNENEPFVGRQPMPPGHALYPADLTRAQVDAYVAAHSDRKALIFDPYTIVRRRGADLTGVKYHDEYAAFIKPAARSSFVCGPTRSSPTITMRATLRGWICRTPSSMSSTRPTRRTWTTCSV
jgi:hypothetical protein